LTERVKSVSVTVPKLIESQRRKSIGNTSKLNEEKMVTELSTPPPKVRTLRTPNSAPASIANQSPRISFPTETKSTRSATAISKTAIAATPTTSSSTPTTPLTPSSSLRKRKIRDNEGTNGSDYKSNTYSTPIKRSKGDNISHSDTKISTTKKKTAKRTARGKGDEIPTGEYKVDRILLKRYNTDINDVEYLIQWEGYKIFSSSWTSLSDMMCNNTIKKFETSWNKKGTLKAGNSYNVGDKVWVKMGKYPWWPAQIVEIYSELEYLVLFYCDYRFAMLGTKSMRKFHMERFVGQEKKYENLENTMAIEEAMAMSDDYEFHTNVTAEE